MVPPRYRVLPCTHPAYNTLFGSVTFWCGSGSSSGFLINGSAQVLPCTHPAYNNVADPWHFDTDPDPALDPPRYFPAHIQLITMLRIRDILIRIRIRGPVPLINGSAQVLPCTQPAYNQCCRTVTFWYGSGSSSGSLINGSAQVLHCTQPAYKTGFESVTFWYGSGSTDPYPLLTDPPRYFPAHNQLITLVSDPWHFDTVPDPRIRIPY